MLPKLRRDLAAGDRIGPYVVDARLGEGGMAEVFSGHHPGTGQRVALKRSLLDPDMLHIRLPMFQREARIACKLLHPNIVTTYEMCIDAEGNPVLVMELLEGLTVKACGPLLRKTIGGTRLTVELVAAVARALDYLHDQADPESDTKTGTLIHRDVAPDNLFVTSSGSVKLLDFGLAKEVDDDRLTRTGILKGKAAFMSPEQAQGAPLDRRTDQYALGITTYWLLTGVCPFERENVPKTLTAVLRDPLTPASQLNRMLPKKVDAVLQRVLARDREGRFPSCGAFAAALDQALKNAEPPVPNVTLAVLVSDAGDDQQATVVSAQRPAPGLFSDDDFTGVKAGNGGEVDTDPRALRRRNESDERTIVESFAGSFSTNEEANASGPVAPEHTVRAPVPDRSASAARKKKQERTPIVRRESGTEIGDGIVRGPAAADDDDNAMSPVFTMPLEVPSALHPAPPPRARGALIAGIVGAVTVASAGALWLLISDALSFRSDVGPDANAVAALDAGVAAAQGAGEPTDASADAGAQASAALSPDAGTAPAETLDADAGATAAATAPVEEAARTIRLRADPDIVWRIGTDEVAQGNDTITVPPEHTEIVAYDPALDVMVLVPIPADARVVDYRALPRTEVQILVRPWAEVTIGNRGLGVTPLKPLKLVPGQYRVTLKHKDQEQTHLIDVGGDERQDFRYRF